jgi:hypothetical protein
MTVQYDDRLCSAVTVLYRGLCLHYVNMSANKVSTKQIDYLKIL